MGICKICNKKYGDAMFLDFKFCPVCGTLLIQKDECIKCGDKGDWLDKRGLCLYCKINMFFGKRKWCAKLENAIMPK